MTNEKKINKIMTKLLSGDLSCMNPDNIILVSNEAIHLIEKPVLNNYDLTLANTIISMSQIVYNNTDRSVLFLDDGVYDLLLEKYNSYRNDFQVGAPVIKFNQKGEEIQSDNLIEPIVCLDKPKEFIENSLYFDDLRKQPPIDMNLYPEVDRNTGITTVKKNVTVPHNYPKLLGSLDKCKFVLNKEAIDRGVFEDTNVKVFERDFLGKHLEMGIIDRETPFEMIAELKYDGVSLEADVTHEILGARSRGDMNNDIAADMTDIFKGMRFPYAEFIPEEESFGIRFEAMLSYINLDRLAKFKDKYYKNSRNAVIGLLGSLDAYNYRDLITLVPLSTSIEGIDRVQEIEFLNKYYNSGEYLRYSILRGNYTQILYQVYKFVQEAEAMRPMMPYMYDGVVIEYRDPRIIERLGRENSIDKYKMAIKFNPLTRLTVFQGYTFTVGQDGTITPMIHYTPVEFYGTIHTKSSGHSRARFFDLNLAKGDIIQVEYTNDVMPYVTKPDIEANRNNKNPVEVFPDFCPFCGSKIIITTSGKSAACSNIQCPERTIMRMANMMDKLNLKDFGEETFRTLGTQSLTQLLNYTLEDVVILGPGNGAKLLQRIGEIINTPIYDYTIMGAIGFSGIAVETWKKILKEIELVDIGSLDSNELFNRLISIKGIGRGIAETIINERNYFKDDLMTIISMPNIIRSYGLSQGKKIRFTGCRPSEEVSRYLLSLGCDARGDAGVTKDTNVLVVPFVGFTSSKTSKVGAETVIVDMKTFLENINNYAL